MLGALSEADDTVQEAWLRLSRSESSTIENLDGSNVSLLSDCANACVLPDWGAETEQ